MASYHFPTSGVSQQRALLLWETFLAKAIAHGGDAERLDELKDMFTFLAMTDGMPDLRTAGQSFMHTTVQDCGVQPGIAGLLTLDAMDAMRVAADLASIVGVSENGEVI